MSTLRPRAPGFTLLEVLVAITLLGLIAALLAGGLRFGTRVWHRGEDQLQALAALQSVHGLMRRELAQAVPLTASDGTAGQVIFEGMPTYVRFAGPAPSDLLVGGEYEITLGLSHDELAQHLVMAWRLLVGSADDSGAPGGEQVLLLRDVAGVSFAYFGADDGADDSEAPQWHESWVERPTLPLLVRVVVSFPDGDPRRWPGLVVAPMLHLPAG
jgi:general secretion pathway protein J